MTIGNVGKVALNANINTEFHLGNAISFYRGVQYYKPATTTIGNFDTANVNFSEFYGTQDKVTVDMYIGSDTQNYTLNPAAVSGYVAAFTKVNLTVNSGVYVGSASTGSYAMTITGFVSGDTVNLINNGVIIGAGGNGGGGNNNAAGDVGNNGGNALRLLCATNITNNGTIAGGGGGGGAADGGSIYGSCFGGGGTYTGSGGGGGAGYSGGSGGSPGGNSGTKTAGGAGGTSEGTGGSGGNQGLNGSASSSGRAGGTAGKYITGISYATWITTGTRIGPSS